MTSQLKIINDTNTPSEILNCLMKYGQIPRKALLQYILNTNSEKETDKIKYMFNGTIKKLIKSGRIFEKRGKKESVITTYYDAEIDERFLDSFWVFTEFSKVLNPKSHFKAAYPSDIYFAQNNKQYEIMSPKTGDEFELSVIKNRNSQIEDEENKINLVVCVLDDKQLTNCISYAGDMDITYAQVLHDGKENPKINIFKI